MNIVLNQIFSTERDADHIQWKELTRGRFEKPLNRFKGIPYFAEVNGRTPLINFHSNPFKEDEEQTPWRDLILQDEGRVIYNGDNKDSSKRAEQAYGNKQVSKILKLYSSNKVEDRMKAPPIIVTKTVKINGRTGYRKFVGVGIIYKSPLLVQQYEKGTDKVFSNFQFEVTLLKLTPNDCLNWNWIDDRRDNNISLKDSLRNAPDSWKQWVKHGTDSLSRITLRINSYRIVSEKEQNQMSPRNEGILSDLLSKHYPDPIRDGIRFEAMASFIATLFFQEYNYTRGWITVGSSDRGVDFVGKLDLGQDDFSKTSLIVLGQSKRYKNSISGERLTRVASRMTRGYIGLVITLSTFTKAAQEEIKNDKLPIILVNGKKVSELLLNYINKTNKKLEQIVLEQDEWAKDNLGTEHYDTILNT